MSPGIEGNREYRLGYILSAAVLICKTFEETPRGAWLLFALYQLIVYAAEGFVFAVKSRQYRN